MCIVELMYAEKYISIRYYAHMKTYKQINLHPHLTVRVSSAGNHVQ